MLAASLLGEGKERREGTMTLNLIDGHKHLVALFIVNSLLWHCSAVRFPGMLGSADNKNIWSKNIVPFCWQLHGNDFVRTGIMPSALTCTLKCTAFIELWQCRVILNAVRMSALIYQRKSKPQHLIL